MKNSKVIDLLILSIILIKLHTKFEIFKIFENLGLGIENIELLNLSSISTKKKNSKNFENTLKNKAICC